MPELNMKPIDRSEVDLPIDKKCEDPGINPTSVRSESAGISTPLAAWYQKR